MYSELIYTRCRQGIDILNGRSITSDGYKVYSCASALLEEGNVDLQFLLNAAQSKQSYSDPAFMDDAYLYYVPDKGYSFLLNFYPVPYDANATGDYSRRPGNFVNHVLAGDFSNFYPFELFRDNSVWNAKLRGEAYYYENAPVPLPLRDITDPVGQLGFDEIGEFIADERKEALAAAVSFLIKQYETEPEKRKFLVISDDSSKKIELWIAAIESAFSPRMSSAVPFATRMDNFVTVNRFAVNQSGLYQTQINLQDPNQKQRYRALIVGVDERDRANINSARPLANSPFVLLDGKEKKAMFDCDTSKKYYNMITSFSNAHQQFCREFLQMIDISSPGSEIYMLFDIFMLLENSDMPNAVTLGKILTNLSRYRLFNTRKLQKIYSRITTSLPQFLGDDAQGILQIINWLHTIARIVKDQDAKQGLTKFLCEALDVQIFKKSDPVKTLEFWESLKKSEFAADIVNHVIGSYKLQDNSSVFDRLKLPDIVMFVTIYIDCFALFGTVEKQNLERVVHYGLQSCFRENDTACASKILKALLQNKQHNIQDILFSIIKDASKDFAEFIIKYIIEYDESIVTSDASMLDFIKRLSLGKMEHLIGIILKNRIEILRKPSELDQFIRAVLTITEINSSDLAIVFEAIDRKINPADKNYFIISSTLQKQKPETAVYKNSAHNYALGILNNNNTNKFIDIFQELIVQGFPSETSSDYVSELNRLLFNIQLNKEEFMYIIQMYDNAPKVYLDEFTKIILSNVAKQQNKWNILIALAKNSSSRNIDEVIVRALADLKPREKVWIQFNDLLTTTPAREYFAGLAERAKEIISSQKSQSILSKIVKRITGSDSEPNEKKK